MLILLHCYDVGQDHLTWDFLHAPVCKHKHSCLFSSFYLKGSHDDDEDDNEEDDDDEDEEDNGEDDLGRDNDRRPTTHLSLLQRIGLADSISDNLNKKMLPQI